MTILDGKSEDILANNIDALKEIFPECVSDGLVDFDTLKQLLGGYIEDNNERYSFAWNGKGNAIRISQTPSQGTLIPDKTSSKNWDTTQNIYIEGDNLEVLKLLQKSYHGKIKMIYIDPPYNTGRDFVYHDDFVDNITNYKILTGQIDTSGNLLSTNSESSGRFHTDWLNMMYPRIRLAKNLLSDDGVIFISVDDNEQENIKKICSEIFGELNFVSQLVWKKKQGGGNDSNHVVAEHEYILCYAKNRAVLHLGLDKKYKLDDALYPYSDDIGDYGLITLDKASIQFSDSLVFDIIGPDGTKYYPRIVNSKQSCWRWSKKKVEQQYDELVFKNGKVYTKYYRPEGVTPRSLLTDAIYGRTESGNDDIKSLFDQNLFSYPKPVLLLKHLTAIGMMPNDIVLDFFSGSATTADAVMQLNAEDGGNRKFIMVQLPEICDAKSEAYKAGYKTICDIGEERIRRSGEKIKAEIEAENEQLEIGKEPKKVPDIGFKVFKLDSSNIKKWNPSEDLETSLQESISNIVDGRTEEDVVYEIMLKMGLDLSYPVEKKTINDRDIYSIGFGALMICLGDNLTKEVAEDMVELYKEQKPETWKVVFKDNGFVTDAAKVNTLEILKNAGLEEDAFTTI